MSRTLIVGIEIRVETSHRVIARQHVMVGGTMIGVAVRKIPDEREMSHLPGQLRQIFPNLNPGDRGGHRGKRAPKLRGSLRLHVQGVDGRESSLEEQQDHRRFRRRTG